MAKRVVKTKSKCCKSGRRCKRCPTVYKKLERRGLAERVSKRRYVVLPVMTKADFRAARSR